MVAKFMLKLSLLVVVLVVAVFVLLLATEWHPREVDRECFRTNEVALPDTLRLVSWNIGYAGLDAQMDFFVDGGQRVRTQKYRAEENLEAIISQLKSLDYVDFILLQEVDIYSKRSYYLDQVDVITTALGYPYHAFALNYNSIFVPVPVHAPMGRTKAGLLTLSKYPLRESVRWQYPTTPHLPERLFNLKRCMLSIAIAACDGMLWVNNIHNTAFDTTCARHREVEFISDMAQRYPRSITAGDWNSTPPGYTPSQSALDNRYFSPHVLTCEDFPQSSHVGADCGVESVRYLDRPYSHSNSTTTVVDFALLGAGLRVLECKTLDLGFKNSDHNPIIITFVH